MSAEKRRRIGRPPGRKAARRPVVASRVPEDFYATVKQAAQLSGRTMSEELIWNARRSLTAQSQLIDKDFRSEMETEFHRLRLENGRLIGVLRDAELIRVNLLAEISRMHELVILLKKPKQRGRKI
jgi:hypothetical protein